MKVVLILLGAIGALTLSSCNLLNTDTIKVETPAEPAGKVVLNFFFENVYWQFNYNDGNTVTGNGGHKGSFDSDYGTSEQKTVANKRIISATMDRILLGDTIIANLELKFDETENTVTEITFDKLVKNKKSEKWNNTFVDVEFVNENDTKKIYRITGLDVCDRTLINTFEYKTNTSGGYTKTIIQSGKSLSGNELGWKKQCTTSDFNKIEVEMYKN